MCGRMNETPYGHDEVYWSRLFENAEWLLAGCVPVDEVARRVGYAKTRSLIRAYARHGRPMPRALMAAAAQEKADRT